MYENFFGLRDKPFKLVPDPEYLFLSPSHRKTLSQLSNALEHGDGFVLIIGEVGTGKTTLCRHFLNGLKDDSVAFAYLFNTQLEGTQLLAAICYEFGILVDRQIDKQSHDYFQVLVQSLNAFLIDQHQSGHKVVLLIDEAQNLTTETLEMVRLLSNLETTRNKLLQIILVGQPELAEKLSTFRMRQLSQRISVHCRLAYLNKRQTSAFIEHRLQIALNHSQRLFTAHALRVIYRFSEGIPRQINIAAHRSLSLAYEQEKPIVTGAIARKAIREIVSVNPVFRPSNYLQKTLAISAVLSVILVAAFVAFLGNGLSAFLKPFGLKNDVLSVAHHKVPSIHSTDQNVFKVPSVPGEKAQNDGHLKSASSESVSSESASSKDVSSEDASLKDASSRDVSLENDSQMEISLEHALEQPQKTVTDIPLAVAPIIAPTLEETIAELGPVSNRDWALVHLLSLWEQPSPNLFQIPESMDHDRFFLVTALQYGLRLLIVQNNLELVRKLNLPAIVSIEPASNQPPVFGVLTQWQENKVRLVFDGLDTGLIDANHLDKLVGEKIYLFWQNALVDNSVISQKSQGESVLQVKRMLNAVGYHHLPDSPFIDPPTYHAIVDFQLSQAIEPDGLIGPVTKILLFQAAKAIEMPRLDLSGSDPTSGDHT